MEYNGNEFTKDSRILTVPYELDLIEYKNYVSFLKSLPDEYKDKKI